MGKKKTGKQYISVGMHSSVGASLTREIRADYKASPERMINQQKAHLAGKKTRFVVPNPNKEETHKQFITVDGKDFFSSKPQGKSF
jgi:hypothetical protein